MAVFQIIVPPLLIAAVIFYFYRRNKTLKRMEMEEKLREERY
jgi:hypothetical protein